MKNAPVVLALSALLGAAGCGKKVARPAPAVGPMPAPQASTAPEAQETTGEDEYSRLKRLSAEEIDRLGLLNDVPFEYDRADIRDDARSILQRNAEALRQFDFLDITIEGHCDERGTVEYNLALGERRASAAQDYLVSLGVAPRRLATTSYGKESPVCRETNEACWARNRRAHFKVTGHSGGN